MVYLHGGVCEDVLGLTNSASGTKRGVGLLLDLLLVRTGRVHPFKRPRMRQCRRCSIGD
jgi:hypothetical protein